MDGGSRVAHFAFEGRTIGRARGEALEGSWRFAAEPAVFGPGVTAWAEHAASGAVVLRASAPPGVKKFRQHLLIEHAGRVFEWKKDRWAARFTLSGDGRSVLVIRGSLRRARIELGTAPSSSTSLGLLLLFAVFLHQRVIASLA
jgi:hypothetical protein